jgi:acyl-ACP thioesterase
MRDERGEICATASSLWVIVDLASRRPVRIPEAIVALCHDPGYVIPPMEEGWLAGPEQVQGEAEFKSYWSDADQNEHVNNVTMVRWAVDGLPLEFLEQHEVMSVEAQYRAEVRVGEVVRVRRERVGDLVRQEVLNELGVVVALVHTRWRESTPSES